MVTDPTTPRRLDAPFEELFETCPFPMCVCDPESLTVLVVNAAAVAEYGYAREACLRMRISDFYPPEIRDLVVRRLRRAGSGGKRHDTARYLRKDGSHRDVELTTYGVTFQGRDACVVLTADISSQVQAEALAALRLREQAVVATLGQAALTHTDLETLTNEALRQVQDVLDAPRCQVLEVLPDGGGLLLRAGVGWRDGVVGRAVVEGGRRSQAGYTLLTGEPVIVPDLAAETRFEVPALLREQDVMSGVSVIIGDPAQPYGVLAVHALKPRRFSQYDVAFLQGVAHVLGAAVERSRTDAAIRASEERFRLLFENSLDAILLTAPDGRVLAANPAACRVFGRSLDDICRAGRAGLIDDSDLWLKPLIEARRQTGCAQGELTFIRGDGTRFPGFCSGSVFHDFQGQARCCLSVRDLTDMKRAEASVADQLAELRRWHDATLGRERRVLELKQEVNELLAAAGQPPRYDSAPDGDGGGEPGR